MPRERIVVNVKTNGRKVVPYTPEEEAAADAAKAADDIKQKAEKLVRMKREAEDAEIRAMVNADTGTTPEAKAYQAEKVKQGV